MFQPCGREIETDSTSATGICRRRGVGRLRHLHRKELWLQDQVAEKITGHGRVPSEDNEADLGTKYFEKDKIEKCVAKISMVCSQGHGLENRCLWFQALVIAAENPIEGQNWNCDGCRVVRRSWSGTAQEGWCVCVLCLSHRR